MSAVEREELWARLDELSADVRRQGRAAIAAQAAAERCLDAVTAAPQSAKGDDTAWLEAIMPVADAIDRLTKAARALADVPEERALFSFLRRRDRQDELSRLAGGLELLGEQLRAAVERMGVEVVRPDGGAFDASRHRAVETRRGPAERVLEVVRAGYVVGRRVVREAEVVVGRP